jgi:hypothetical protein
MNLKSIILIVLVAVAAAGITRYYFPKVEFRDVEVTKEVVRTDVKTIVKTVERPDGTKETTTETTDHSVKHETSTKDIQIAAKKDWMFDVGARLNVSNRDVIVYDLQVQRRILGPFFLGAKASTDKTVGVSVGMEF